MQPLFIDYSCFFFRYKYEFFIFIFNRNIAMIICSIQSFCFRFIAVYFFHFTARTFQCPSVFYIHFHIYSFFHSRKDKDSGIPTGVSYILLIYSRLFLSAYIVRSDKVVPRNYQTVSSNTSAKVSSTKRILSGLSTNFFLNTILIHAICAAASFFS